MIRLGYFLFCSVLFIALGSNVTFAVFDTFTVSQLVGSDTIAPTVPASVTATPIAFSQIDVAWDASTDDQNLTGYQLFRDAVQIATTSLTTYSDTGLTASTTYTYTVKAYDWFFNISSSSLPAATTTLAVPVVVVATTTNPTVTGTRTSVSLMDLSVEPSQTHVQIAWTTNVYARYALRWGKQSTYELGFVQNETFKKNHTTTITDLEPGTLYMYELVAYNQQGREYVLARDSFSTSAPEDTQAPANVAHLSAAIQDDSVYLSWSNPPDDDFDKVRIVRSYMFYPGSPASGYIAYEGTGESFVDVRALQDYSTQYYTIFTYDILGNISSGAVIAVRASESVFEDVQTPPLETPVATTTDQTATTTSSTPLSFSDIEVVQYGAIITTTEDVARVDNRGPVTLRIPYALLPEHLKTIVVSVGGLGAEPVSYLLRVNNDTTAYQAVVPPQEEIGTRTLSFVVYDFQTEVLTEFAGALMVYRAPASQGVGVPILSTLPPIQLVLSGITLLLLFLWLLLIRRKRLALQK